MFPGGSYYVILRGNHREPLFENRAHRDALNTIVADVIQRFDAQAHAFPFVSYKPRSNLTLEQLASDICKQHAINLDMVRSRSSSRALTPIRIQILHQAIHQRIASLTEVARFLDCDPSTLCKLSRGHQSKVQ